MACFAVVSVKRLVDEDHLIAERLAGNGQLFLCNLASEAAEPVSIH